MNIFSLANLFDGIFDRDPLRMAFAMAQGMPHPGYYNYYKGPNQRRQRQSARRSIFANRRIKRGF